MRQPSCKAAVGILDPIFILAGLKSNGGSHVTCAMQQVAAALADTLGSKKAQDPSLRLARQRATALPATSLDVYCGSQTVEVKCHVACAKEVAAAAVGSLEAATKTLRPLLVTGEGERIHPRGWQRQPSVMKLTRDVHVPGSLQLLLSMLEATSMTSSTTPCIGRDQEEKHWQAPIVNSLTMWHRACRLHQPLLPILVLAGTKKTGLDSH